MKYWIGTVSKEHVLRGVAGGFCQVCHGKAAPLNRMKRGDWLLYYSPKISLYGHEKWQAFTACGQIADDTAYPFRMSEDFIPFRRNVVYSPIQRDCPLDIARTHPEWKMYASQLRYGHFAISEDFFSFVQGYMLAPSKNVFIVSASAVNYRHEQKNLPKRYQSRAICASPSPAGKCP